MNPVIFKSIQMRLVKVKVVQLYLTLCDPMDCTVHGILQARILEWVAVPFSRGSLPAQVYHIAGRFFPAEPPVNERTAGLMEAGIWEIK